MPLEISLGYEQMRDGHDRESVLGEDASHLRHGRDRVVDQVKSLSAHDAAESGIGKRKRQTSDDIGTPEMSIEVEPPHRSRRDEIDVRLRAAEEVEDRSVRRER